MYLSIDVETTHDVPGVGSMLSLGVCAIQWSNRDSKWGVVSEFYKKLIELPEGTWNPAVIDFWKTCPKALEEATTNSEDPAKVMLQFRAWCTELKWTWRRDLVPFANPAGYDYSFLRYYMVRFAGDDEPLGHRCADMRSVVAEKLKIPFRQAGKGNYPRQWSRDGFEHTHSAIEDAREQAFLWARMLDN